MTKFFTTWKSFSFHFDFSQKNSISKNLKVIQKKTIFTMMHNNAQASFYKIWKLSLLSQPEADCWTSEKL